MMYIIASPSLPSYFSDALDIRETDLTFSGSFEEVQKYLFLIMDY